MSRHMVFISNVTHLFYLNTQTFLVLKSNYYCGKKAWKTWIEVSGEMCVMCITIVSAKPTQHEIACIMVSTYTELFFAICFCFSPPVFAQDMCPEVPAYKASILSFSSYFMIQNKMPSGHHVIHIISAMSAHIRPFF